MPGTISSAGQTTSIQFKIDPSQFTATKRGTILLGLDVAAASGSTVVPEIVSVKNASGRSAGPLIHAVYTAQIIKAQKLKDPISSAVMIKMPIPKTGAGAATYTVQIKGGANTTVRYLLGFYLPGDVAGTGQVTTADLQTIKQDLGATPSSSKYSFDADVNRDGVVSPADLAFADMNLGAKTTISPIVTVNLDPATDWPLNDRITNINPVHFTGTVTPNATVTFTEINGNSPGAQPRPMARATIASGCLWATAPTPSR